MYLPCGIWAWVIDGRYVPGRLIDPHPETLRQKSATAGVDVMARRINVQIAGQDPSRNDWLTR